MGNYLDDTLVAVIAGGAVAVGSTQEASSEAVRDCDPRRDAEVQNGLIDLHPDEERQNLLIGEGLALKWLQVNQRKTWHDGML